MLMIWLIPMFLNKYDGEEHVNVDTREEISIKDLVILICNIIGYKGEIIFDVNMNDRTPRKVCNVSRIRKIG